MPDPVRIDLALVERGLARSRGHAGRLVRSGRVLLEGRPVAKPSTPVAGDAALEVAPDDAPEYVSRAGHKLAGALDAFASVPAVRSDGSTSGYGPQVAGAFCLDVGASTGGFTEVLLRRGARGVLALDVGHDQLAAHLRDDPRVLVQEGFNVRDLTGAGLPEPAATVVGDLSFISLRLVVPVLAAACPGADLVLMVKPQFEVGRERLGRGGVVRDPALHVRAVLDVASCAAEHGLGTRAVVASPLPGPSGNREFFCWFSPHAPAADPAELERAVRDAVGRSGDGAAVPRVEDNGRRAATPSRARTHDRPDEGGAR